jgi:DNA-binding NarL/FixJ family response regulator
VRAQYPTARIVVLTTFDTENDISRAVTAGARGYLLKDAPREELLETIRQIHRGEMHLSPALIAKLASGLGDEALTTREQNVLELLALGRSNKDIGLALDIGETTVKSHLRSIFAKLGVVSRTEAISVASRRGLLER